MVLKIVGSIPSCARALLYFHAVYRGKIPEVLKTSGARHVFIPLSYGKYFPVQNRCRPASSCVCTGISRSVLLQCTVTKSDKRSFPLENNPPEEGKFPCGYWNIFPVTHTVFIHSSVWEKYSRLWTGTFYRSKKVNFLELSFLTDISGKFPHSVFLNDISGKFPQSCGKNVLCALPLKQKT